MSEILLKSQVDLKKADNLLSCPNIALNVSISSGFFNILEIIALYTNSSGAFAFNKVQASLIANNPSEQEGILAKSSLLS